MSRIVNMKVKLSSGNETESRLNIDSWLIAHEGNPTDALMALKREYGVHALDCEFNLTEDADLLLAAIETYGQDSVSIEGATLSSMPILIEMVQVSCA